MSDDQNNIEIVNKLFIDKNITTRTHLVRLNNENETNKLIKETAELFIWIYDATDSRFNAVSNHIYNCLKNKYLKIIIVNDDKCGNKELIGLENQLKEKFNSNEENFILFCHENKDFIVEEIVDYMNGKGYDVNKNISEPLNMHTKKDTTVIMNNQDNKINYRIIALLCIPIIFLSIQYLLMEKYSSYQPIYNYQEKIEIKTHLDSLRNEIINSNKQIKLYLEYNEKLQNEINQLENKLRKVTS